MGDEYEYTYDENSNAASRVGRGGVSSTLISPLASSLAAPRATFGVPLSSQTVPAPSNLSSLRISDAREAFRIARSEVDSVRALSDAPQPTGASTARMTGVAAMESSRKARHGAHVKAFEDAQRALYTELEVQVLAAGRALTASMADADAAVDGVVARLTAVDDARVAGESAGDVMHGGDVRTEGVPQAEAEEAFTTQALATLSRALADVDAAEAGRRVAGDTFCATLTAIEVRRGTEIGAALAVLADNLVRTLAIIWFSRALVGWPLLDFPLFPLPPYIFLRTMQFRG